ncbi:ubiquinol-cytochrome c reductase iron-sulfur subunit [Mycolicibacterium komossense]|uniref:Cytochrome bc1 complex Rieske iron-sulfur subunit n=1 Tax=Mycolicibacterium komossense TaxID=1779 RepID=A0ABT3C972_9MYCO|nr:Rieske (2Fe-2S) protein [Mycolicibacterium komossense]MCV7225971.1 Rieske (2Fe-2S) protein [Mycolicibacterium komossense]
MSTLGEISANRRAVIAAVPAAVALPCFLAGCASEAPKSAPVEGSSTATGGHQIDATEVPVGSAVIVAGAKPVAVAQPTAGQFVAFSATCTHRGTTVAAQPGSTTLVCPSHGSQFSAATGQVLKGPATAPLASVPVTDANGVLTLG